MERAVGSGQYMMSLDALPVLSFHVLSLGGRSRCYVPVHGILQNNRGQLPIVFSSKMPFNAAEQIQLGIRVRGRYVMSLEVLPVFCLERPEPLLGSSARDLAKEKPRGRPTVFVARCRLMWWNRFSF